MPSLEERHTVQMRRFEKANRKTLKILDDYDKETAEAAAEKQREAERLKEEKLQQQAEAKAKAHREMISRLPAHLKLVSPFVKYIRLEDYVKRNFYDNHLPGSSDNSSSYKPATFKSGFKFVLRLCLTLYGIGSVREIKEKALCFRWFSDSQLYGQIYKVLHCSSVQGIVGKGLNYDHRKVTAYFRREKVKVLAFLATITDRRERQRQKNELLGKNSEFRNAWPENSESLQKKRCDLYRKLFSYDMKSTAKFDAQR